MLRILAIIIFTPLLAACPQAEPVDSAINSTSSGKPVASIPTGPGTQSTGVEVIKSTNPSQSREGGNSERAEGDSLVFLDPIYNIQLNGLAEYSVAAMAGEDILAVKQVSWAVEPEGQVEVLAGESTLILVGKQLGPFTLKAESAGLRTEIRVQVVAAEAQLSIVPLNTVMTSLADETIDLAMLISGQDPQIITEDISLISMSPDIVHVEKNEEGSGFRLHALTSGRARLEARWNGHVFQADYDVNGPLLDNIRFAESGLLEATLDEEFSPPIEALWADGTVSRIEDFVSWSYEQGFAMVDDKLVPNEVGEWVLTANFGGRTITADVRNTPSIEFDSLRIHPSFTNVPLGLPVPLELRAIQGSDYTVVTEGVLWMSSNPEVATVENGVVTAVSLGNAQISAVFAGEPIVNAQVLVTEAAVVGLTIHSKADDMVIDQSIACGVEFAEYTATGTLSDGETVDLTEAVSWSSGSQTVLDLAVAPNNATGRFEGYSQGQTTARASFVETITGTSFNATAQVTVTAPGLLSTELLVNRDSIAAGEEFNFTLRGHYTCGPPQALSSNSPAISWGVAAPPTGGVTFDFQSPPLSNIAATGGDPSSEQAITVSVDYQANASTTMNATRTVTVRPAEVAELEIMIPASSTSANIIELEEGAIEQLDITATLSNGIEEDLSYLISKGYAPTFDAVDPLLIDIDNDGLLEIIGKGDSRIRVRTVNPITGGALIGYENVRSYRKCPSAEPYSTHAGFCWYLGQPGNSCTQTCSAVSGVYDELATLYGAGSAAVGDTEDYCRDIVPDSVQKVSSLLEFNGAEDGQGVGCAINTENNILIRVRNRTTTADDTFSGMARICGCYDAS